MTNLQLHNDLEKLMSIMPKKVSANLTSEGLEDVIEIVLDVGRVPEIRRAGGKIEKLDLRNEIDRILNEYSGINTDID